MIYEIKRIFLLLICVVVSCFMVGQPLYATSTKSNVEKSFTLYTNMTKEIKINNPDTKVTWSTSKKKIASILGKRGENDCIVTIKTGKKIGKCYVKAKVGNKIYKYKITVKKDTKKSRAKLVKTIQNKKAIKVKIKLTNKTKKTIEYGEIFSVEKFNDGNWEKLQMKEDVGFQLATNLLQSKKSVNKTYNLSICYESSDLGRGTYRICVDAKYKKAYRYVIFKLK